MHPTEMRKLGDLFAIQAELHRLSMPEPSGFVAPATDLLASSDFNRVDWPETPVKLTALRAGTQLNAFFTTLAFGKNQSELHMPEVRVPITEMERIKKILGTKSTHITQWNSLMVDAVKCFAGLPSRSGDGIPDEVIEGFIAGAGIKPMQLMRQTA